MNFYELEAFLALAKTLHFGKTASKLNMSPSALTRLISRLEEELGVSLFDRNNRQIYLTDQGKIFEKFAQESLSKRADLKVSLSGNGERIEGVLPLYASVTACYTVLPDFIKRLTEKYPGIQLSVETGDPAAAISAVKENRALLAIGAIPETGLASMETVSVVKTPLVYAASKNGPYTKLEGSPQDILSSVPLVLPKAGLARSRFDKWIKSRNVKPIIAAETEGNEAILAIAQLGLGIGLVPQIVLENGPYRGEFIIHTAGNILGYYDVGFIRKATISGTTSSRRIQEAVESILSQY
ncbi:MAG: HTH-type transcriptional activator IlvY [Treponema sp.]|nr:HTH-type transcriptional activator IlvY [Treponema sp.]MCI7565995.1 HTH-type transcriptional activator IlvY [Treponema sp.]